jgi:hypothetical protein
MLSEIACPDKSGKSRLSAAKAGFAGKNLSLLFIATIFAGLIAAGCSTTTYLSLTENNKEQIEQKISYDEQEKDVGAEITLSLQNGEEINGELLSIKESSLTICTEYSAKEVELANLTYPIIPVRYDEIKELTIKGGNYVWIGFLIGSAVFTGIGIIVGHGIEAGLDVEDKVIGMSIFGFFVGAIAGGIVGYLLSTDNVILKDIPPEYDFSLLKSLARYPDEEPKYLRAIP